MGICISVSNNLIGQQGCKNTNFPIKIRLRDLSSIWIAFDNSTDWFWTPQGFEVGGVTPYMEYEIDGLPMYCPSFNTQVKDEKISSENL
ncbi:hypothetical protein AVEN_194305-1 [Araneus ventricosus]|nr:hypothetical protein AVEN_194305-1 [Araneus ventricosus]